MGQLNEAIEHDGGVYIVEVDLEGDQAVIYFGPSFTLRVNESSVDKLRALLYEASRGLARKRAQGETPNATEQDTVNDFPEALSEDKFIQDGIDAREQQKLNRMMQGTASPITNDPIDW